MRNNREHVMGESIIGPGRKQKEEVVHQALNSCGARKGI